MIITAAEVKSLLQISGSAYDSFIDAMIPVVQDFVIQYTNNYFEILTDSVYRDTNTLSFVTGSPAKINDSQNKFVDMGFVAGIHIRVNGSKFNDGIYKVDSVSARTLTLSSDDSLTNESEDSEVVIKITVVQFPKGIQLPVAQLIGYNFEKRNMKGVQSERLGDHSISYQSGGGYPKSLLEGLNQYRNLKFVGGSTEKVYDMYTKRNA